MINVEYVKEEEVNIYRVTAPWSWICFLSKWNRARLIYKNEMINWNKRLNTRTVIFVAQPSLKMIWSKSRKKHILYVYSAWKPTSKNKYSFVLSR